MRVILALAFVVLAAASGCAYPDLRVEGGNGPAARENLARFLVNRAVREVHEAKYDEARVSAELALEAYPLAEAKALTDALREATSDGKKKLRPPFVHYSGEPGLPERRKRNGEIARAVLYPVLGLPFDLVELPIKAVIATPGVGHVVVFAPAVGGFVLLIVGAVIKPDDDEEEENAHEYRKDLRTHYQVLGTGATLIVGPVLAFMIWNLVEILAYPDGAEDRFDTWATPLTWWYREP